MLISFNGELSSDKEQKFDLTESSLNRGFGVFETMRTYDLKVFRLKYHIDRLFDSAQIIGLKSRHSREDVERNLNEILNKWKDLAKDGSLEKEFKQNSKFEIRNSKFTPEARIKILLTENYLLIFFTLNTFDHSIYNGIKTISYKGERFLPSAKTINCLVSHMANTKAKKEGCFEAILINSDGYVTEGAYSNIFWIENGILFTTDKGILDGITRDTILANAGKYIKEIRFNNQKTIGDLRKVDEIFMSQSSKGIVPIIEIDGVDIGTGVTGEHTKKLMGIFD